MRRRLIAATIGGAALALLYSVVAALIGAALGQSAPANLVTAWLWIYQPFLWWSTFIFAFLAAIGAIVAELKLPEPA